MESHGIFGGIGGSWMELFRFSRSDPDIPRPPEASEMPISRCLERLNFDVSIDLLSFLSWPTFHFLLWSLRTTQVISSQYKTTMWKSNVEIFRECQEFWTWSLESWCRQPLLCSRSCRVDSCPNMWLRNWQILAEHKCLCHFLKFLKCSTETWISCLYNYLVPYWLLLSLDTI